MTHILGKPIPDLSPAQVAKRNHELKIRNSAIFETLMKVLEAAVAPNKFIALVYSSVVDGSPVQILSNAAHADMLRAMEMVIQKAKENTPPAAQENNAKNGGDA